MAVTVAKYRPPVRGHTKNLDYPNHGLHRRQDHQRPTKTRPRPESENILRDNTFCMEKWTSMSSSDALLLQFTTEIGNEKESEGPRTAIEIGTGTDDILAATAILPAVEGAALVDGGQIGVQHQQILPGTGRWPRGWDYNLIFCFFSGDCILFFFSSGSASRFPYQRLGLSCVIYPVRVLLLVIVAVAHLLIAFCIYIFLHVLVLRMHKSSISVNTLSHSNQGINHQHINIGSVAID